MLTIAFDALVDWAILESGGVLLLLLSLELLKALIGLAVGQCAFGASEVAVSLALKRYHPFCGTLRIVVLDLIESNQIRMTLLLRIVARHLLV